MKTISFKTSFFSGDIIYHMSAINAVCGKLEAKADLYIWLDRIAATYPGAVHPVKDITGKKEVSCNAYMLKMLKPLLEAQPYINLVESWNGETVNVDMDIIKEREINQPYGDLRMWPGKVFPDMCCDISQKSLVLPPYKLKMGRLDEGYILVNRTERYLNTSISHFFLKDYPNVVFVGTPKEHNIFKKQVPHAVYIQPDNFLELAKLIDNAKFTIGNQSLVFAIAEQLKVPRILEVCTYAPNVIPAGPNGYDFLVQTALEYYVNKLWRGETP